MSEVKDKKTIRYEFFWKIPGDVPGYRGQPDPFQSARIAADNDYQLPAHLSIAQDDRYDADSTNQYSPGSDSKIYRLFLIVVLSLIVFGLGIVADNNYIPDSGELLKHEVSDTRSVAFAQVEEEPRIFELTLGEKARTPQSKPYVVTHMVVKGDTLWDIAAAYVNDPFRYPELAALSDIKNPDLIYPYDLVRIHIYK